MNDKTLHYTVCHLRAKSNLPSPLDVPLIDFAGEML